MALNLDGIEAEAHPDTVNGRTIRALVAEVRRLRNAPVSTEQRRMLEAVLAPLLKNLEEERAEVSRARELAEGESKTAEAQRREAVETTIKRFRASLVVELLAGQAASDTLAWNAPQKEVADALELVDLVLNAVGLEVRRG